MIDRTFAHYRILERLGAGGMGEVYRAHDTHLDRDVAIKVLPAGLLGDEAARRRFRREAKALSRLNHAHIATVYDFDSASGVDFLVMEYVPGPTLSERIATGPLSEREIVTLGGDVAAALEEAHERGIVHRDLKPANIVVTPKGRAKVLDFGVAQLSGPIADIEQTTTQPTSEVAGTLPYMSPEQVRGDTLDARTDIYAFGVVLFEMGTGRRPFDERHTARLTDAILHAPLTPPTQWQPRLHPELERITVKCLERDPENRYQSAKEAGIDLRRLASPTTLSQPSPAARRSVSSRPLALAVGVAIVAVAAGASIWLGPWGRRDESGRSAVDDIVSIVALPSKVVAQASDQFLADAIPNTISAHLTQVSGLETRVPPTSGEVERVRGDLGKLADAYGVSAFVLSSLTAEADRLVLNVQLVDARSRRLLWSRDFEGRRDGYLVLARGAAEALRGAVRPQAVPVVPQATTSNSEAELAYQRGLYHFDRYNNQHEKADFDQSLAAFLRALTLDPKMADAAACLAWLYEFAIEAGSPVDQLLPEVRRWGQRAIDIDDRNSRAWAGLAVAELIGTPARPRDALVYALRAASRGPRDAFAVNGVGIALSGTASSLVLAASEEAARLDPLYLYPPINTSEVLIYLNRPTEALAYAEKVLQLEPEMPAGLIRKALALFELKRAAEISDLIPILQRQASQGRADPEYVSMITDASTLLGGAAPATRAALDRLERQARNPGPWAEYTPVYAWLVRYGRIDGALGAIEARVRHGRVPYDFLRLAPEFKALASNDRYLRALEVARRQFDDMVALLREAEGRSELPAFIQQPLLDLLRTLQISSGQRARR
jgi:serine/threonine protein kinase/tetratricopeptide (TPR) repeat protein